MSTTGADLRAWNEFAEHWITHADRIAALTEGASDALVARLRPAPGQRLLDIAAGVGDPTLRLARLVGPTGHVTATDGVADMCAALRQRATARKFAHVSVHAMAAEELELPAAAHDGACCRFGAMFFADPREALLRMRRAVRHDGRLVLAVWGGKQANPYFTLAMETLDELGAPSVPVDPGTHTVFEFAQSGALLGLAREAGWRNTQEDVADFSMTIPETTPDLLLDTLASLSNRVADRLAVLDPSTLAAARTAVARRGSQYSQGPHIVFPARILLISGQS